MKKYLILLLVSFLAVGCASYRPIVDMKGVDQAQYEKDLSECQQYAEQVDVGGDTATTGAVGVGVGGAIGAVSGGRRGFGVGAAIGGITGVTSGASHAGSSQKQVINRCLIGRGYRVLH